MTCLYTAEIVWSVLEDNGKWRLMTEVELYSTYEEALHYTNEKERVINTFDDLRFKFSKIREHTPEAIL